MKISIGLLDEFQLVLYLVPSPAGLMLQEIVFVFLHRPGHPHVTLYSTPRPGKERLEPHFTAFRGSKGEVRRTLARVRPETFQTQMHGMLLDAAREQLRLWRPVSLDHLERDGWRVHVLDVGAVQRWARIGAAVRLDERTIPAIMRSILRHHYPPNALRGLETVSQPLFVAMRRGPDDQTEGQWVSHFARGIFDPSTVSGPRYPAGWFVAPFDANESFLDRPDFEAPVQKVFAQVERLLARYPRKGEMFRVEPQSDPTLTTVFGFFLERLLQAIVLLKIEQEPRPDGPSTDSPPER